MINKEKKMKRFLATTVIALTLGNSALADNHMTDWTASVEPTAGQFYGSNLIGMRVYRAEAEYETGDEVMADAESGWDDIGEINDLIITQGGEVEAVILGIGGFLGLGERDVAIKMDAIRILHEEGESDDRFLVVNATRDQLGTVPEYNRDAAMMNDGTERDPKTGANMGTDAAMAPPSARTTVAREGYGEISMVDAHSMTAEDLQGARVYGVNEEDLGEISELLLEDGKLIRAVIDVGGFLGIGEKPVAIGFDQLQILKNAESGEIRVYMDSTEEALKNQPDYEG
jgi:ribosomal 30S subunit maturation factor RimM